MIKKILQEGFILKTKGYYKPAIEAFYKALEYDNTSSELLLEIADCYYSMGEEERALNYIEQILEKDPTHIDTLKLLKLIFVNKKAWPEAEQTGKNIYLISQKSEDLVEIFDLLIKQEKYSEIFEYKSDICTVEILFQKALAKMHLNQLEEAEQLVNQALESSSNNDLIFLKCKILYKKNQKDESIELLKKLNIDKTNHEMINFIGLIKQYECDFKSALEYFKEALKLAPSKDEYYYNCASTYFKIGDLQQAKRFYNLAISLEPNNQHYHFALANLYYSEKQYKRALEELNYDFFEANLLKMIILYDSGYIAVAKRELNKLTLEQPENELVIAYKEKIEAELRI